MSKIIGITVGTPLSPSTIKDKLKPVLSVNGTKADENGNVEIAAGGASEVPDEDMLQLLAEMDIVQPLANANNAVYVDANNKVYIL
jgi:hypothetical protein